MEKQDEVKLTPAQKAEKKFLSSTFKGQLTETGLADLKVRFPSNLVIDMTNDDNLKQARKDRTECNKLVECINRRRIDFSTDLKLHGDALIAEVKEIFDVVVIPFEKEDKRRKDLAEELRLKHEKLLKAEREQLEDIRGYVDTAKESDPDDISSLIDGLGNIEITDFHQDLAHEVATTLKEVNTELTNILMQKIETKRLKAANEAAEEAALLAKEAAKLAEESAKQAEAQAEAKRVLEARINNLRMMPLDLTGKSAKAIRSKIAALEKFEVPQEEFGDRYQEAVGAKTQVIATLKTMFNGAEQLEAFQAQQEQQALEAQQALAKQAQENTPEPEPELKQQEPEVTHYREPEQTHQEPEQAYQAPAQRQTSRAMSPQEALSHMKPASQLVNQEPEPSQFAKDLNAWYLRQGITDEAFEDLMAVLNNYGINTL